jgi:CHAD domain-containing protein
MQERKDHLQMMAAEFKAELERCLAKPEEESVHRVRTGTRRVQAMVETVIREAGTPELQQPALGWLKELKRIRRAAAPVRDLDVHRDLLKKLVARERKAEQKPNSDPNEAVEVSEPDLITAPAALLPASPLEQQADHLDAWLKHAREHQADTLKKEIAKRAKKLSDREAAFESALASVPVRSQRRTSKSAALVALEAFVRLSDEMPVLDADNLHDFRKGAKNARYIAESGDEEESAQAVAKTLKKLQDDIGDWHDWLVLSEEARTALDNANELIAVLDSKVAKLYSSSLKTAARLRGQLMGEWQALRTQRPPRTTASRPKKSRIPTLPAS